MRLILMLWFSLFPITLVNEEFTLMLRYQYILKSLIFPLKKSLCSFSWSLGGRLLLQDETEHLFSSQWLQETYSSGLWMQTSYLLWEVYGHRSCWHFGWRMEGLYGSNQWWEWQTSFPHEAGCLDPWLHPSAKGHSYYRPRRTRERKLRFVRVAVWMPISVFSTLAL